MAITLTASTGRIAGSRSSTRLRTDGLVPAVVYGLGRDAIAVSVPWPDLRRALTTEAGLNALITLDVDGQKDLAIIKDLQRHPVRRNVLHIDFLRVDPDAPVAVEVPLILVGEAKLVEARKGIVDQPLKSLTVKAKPADIPSQIEIDITNLDIGVAITVETLTMPAGVTTDIDDSIQLVLGLATRFSAEDGAEAGEAGETPVPGEPAAEVAVDDAE
ncbi:MAG: 50S ribosomal protein L25 [Acidimicrobiia bacterium]|nr:50S ribosomal protein L25 [Acidimicrobiia bacterium]